jgi:antitoxin VapB
MAFHVRDPETDRLVRQLAAKRGIGLTETVREAVSEALAHQSFSQTKNTSQLRDRLKPLLKHMDALPKTGVGADKQFFDELWDEEHEQK